ncbi:MAG TPA: hypothetical protein VL354_00500 [Spirochaetia bacterium]|nr:hypothetical protein [Spirochaetia bacterium]
MQPHELKRHLTETYGISESDFQHFQEEFLAFYDQTLEEFVCRRHQELQKTGMKNAEIFRRIQREAAGRRFAVRELSERQIRRLVYG